MTLKKKLKGLWHFFKKSDFKKLRKFSKIDFEKVFKMSLKFSLNDLKIIFKMSLENFKN